MHLTELLTHIDTKEKELRTKYTTLLKLIVQHPLYNKYVDECEEECSIYLNWDNTPRIPNGVLWEEYNDHVFLYTTKSAHASCCEDETYSIKLPRNIVYYDPDKDVEKIKEILDTFFQKELDRRMHGEN